MFFFFHAIACLLSAGSGLCEALGLQWWPRRAGCPLSWHQTLVRPFVGLCKPKIIMRMMKKMRVWAANMYQELSLCQHAKHFSRYFIQTSQLPCDLTAIMGSFYRWRMKRLSKLSNASLSSLFSILRRVGSSMGLEASVGKTGKRVQRYGLRFIG